MASDSHFTFAGAGAYLAHSSYFKNCSYVQCTATVCEDGVVERLRYLALSFPNATLVLVDCVYRPLICRWTVGAVFSTTVFSRGSDEQELQGRVLSRQMLIIQAGVSPGGWSALISLRGECQRIAP